MNQHNVMPRTLADDLLILAAGDKHVDDIINANNVTHEFLEDMGAAIATNKSVLFSSNVGNRKTLRKVIWRCSQTTIKVLNQFRDLGAHINVTNAAQSITINTRSIEAADAVNKLNRLPLSQKQKTHQARTRCLPKGLHGVETAKLGETNQRRLTTVIKQTISKKCRHKDRNLTFLTSSRGDDLDPETNILCRRALMLRRAVAKKPKLQALAQKVLAKYIQHDYTGTNVTDVDKNLVAVAPLPGQRQRQAWAPLFPPLGQSDYYCPIFTRKRPPWMTMSGCMCTDGPILIY